MAQRPLVIGHRGDSAHAPENTLVAFERAFAAGADGIEADFRLTADGEIVCLHDASTGRTAGVDLPVHASTLAELRRLDVGAWLGRGWGGARIPTLREVLDLLPDRKRLYIELKSGPEILPALAALFRELPVSPEQVRFLSFDAGLIRLVKERLPLYRACWLTDYRWRGAWFPSQEEILETLGRVGADGLASRASKALEPTLVARLRQRGAELHVWTVDRADEANRFLRLNVDSVMTNRPGWLRHFFDREGAIPGKE